ncbi:BQ2448_1077 [Microbotryum intermedium]|uniref:BQ2448_1077 protein n=1 Tax=Microbotryum intermedium TaxID=269621 RepID=A0A238FCE8_9BASI|nr:BQ2448_1077 [Microbotryum intermedium]
MITTLEPAQQSNGKDRPPTPTPTTPTKISTLTMASTSSEKFKMVEGKEAALQVEHLEEMTQEARDAHTFEQNLTMAQSVRLYKKGVGWSLLLSMAIIMEGYDSTLLPSFFAFPPFVEQYGTRLPDGSVTISASWQTGLSVACQVGSIVGLFLNGVLVDRYGYKNTMLASLIFMVLVIFIPFFATNLEVLLIGFLAQGIPWGIFSTLACSYASEVCCTKLRPILATWINACWVLGQLVASGILRGFLGRSDQWIFFSKAYRIPYALQWLWPVGILAACAFAPESPWFLVRQGREDDAVAVVRRLTSPDQGSNFSPEANVAWMSYTNKMEESVSAGTSYLDCFRGIDRRRTEIACAVWSIQNMCGSAFMGYSTYFLQRAGFSPKDSFNLSLGQYAIGLVGTVLSWCLMDMAGRRTIYTYGLAILCSVLLVIGFMGIATSPAAVRAVGAMLLLYTLIYDVSVGPVCYSLVAEMSSTRLRVKTVVLARNFYNLFGIVNFIIMPRFISPDALNWGAKSGLFWSALCFLCFVYCFFRLPEPKNRSFGELDLLFAQRVSARKFSSTQVDPTATHHSTRTLLEGTHVCKGMASQAKGGTVMAELAHGPMVGADKPLTKLSAPSTTSNSTSVMV